MISNNEFVGLVDSLYGRNLCGPGNRAQYDAVTYSDPKVLQIVAGPGSGKTTVLVLRALRLVFVEDILPEKILITTFTRKAARELRTRWLEWGMGIMKQLEVKFNLSHIDLNRCRIDTLDSVVQQVLTEFRPAGTLAPIVAENSASNLILRRSSFGYIYRGPNEAVLDCLLKRYTFEGNEPGNRGEALRTTKSLMERLVQDCADLDQYRQEGNAQELIFEMLSDYVKQANRHKRLRFYPPRRSFS